MSASTDQSSVTVSVKGPGGFAGQTAHPTVVWLTGEHDVANASVLSKVVALTIALDEEDVIIDLSGASFISGATVAIFVRADAFLGARSRALILRSPRRSAVRLLELCGLAKLIAPPPSDAVSRSPDSQALRTWVDVPIAARQTQVPTPTADAPSGPARAAARVDVLRASELVTALDQAEGPDHREP